MRIVCLGGAGEMGSRAVKDLAAQADVEKLTIADINLFKAKSLAEEINAEVGNKVEVVHIDVNVPETLERALEGHDIATSTVGPFYKFGQKIAKGVIGKGLHLVDICDDYDAVQQILTLDEEAQANQQTILTGMGWTPGLSNMLALKAVRELDRAEHIHIYWAGSPLGPTGLAVILHTLHIFVGEIPSYQNGEWVNVKAGSGRQVVNFADLGDVTQFHVGHPEPVTIPRYIESLKTVTLKGGLTDHFLNELAVLVGNSGFTGSEDTKDILGGLLKVVLPFGEMLLPSKETRSAIRVDVIGFKDGVEKTISYQARAPMADLTGLPLAVGALMLGRGEITRRGAFAPEAAVDPDKFLAELQKRGIEILRESN
ncbi:MAG: saccharopine dehydrogenase NADP-binding domain-containing protein [Clostridia bacterium]|nr:saccharopine dehydrogenase NADP-binding domain-containing protein [Clostridia bacterium]